MNPAVAFDLDELLTDPTLVQIQRGHEVVVAATCDRSWTKARHSRSCGVLRREKAGGRVNKLPCTRPQCADPMCDREHLSECERCGALVEELFEVEDNDLSVGYRDTGLVCESCSRKGVV